MRPRCTSAGVVPEGSIWYHCAAARVGCPYGTKTVCAHQMVPLRIRQLSNLLSPVSIFTEVPNCGPKSPLVAPGIGPRIGDVDRAHIPAREGLRAHRALDLADPYRAGAGHRSEIGGELLRQVQRVRVAVVVVANRREFAIRVAESHVIAGTVLLVKVRLAEDIEVGGHVVAGAADLEQVH